MGVVAYYEGPSGGGRGKGAMRFITVASSGTGCEGRSSAGAYAATTDCRDGRLSAECSRLLVSSTGRDGATVDVRQISVRCHRGSIAAAVRHWRL